MLVGVETRPLVEACLELQFAGARVEIPIEIRCGITSGDVILHEGDDYIGHSVNVSARLCDLAKGGEVLAGREIVDSLPKWGMSFSEEEISLRGLEQPIIVAKLGLRTLEGKPEPDPICGIPLTPAVADSIARDALGVPVLFCSDSCRDTWEHRPKLAQDGQGSLRMPLSG